MPGLQCDFLLCSKTNSLKWGPSSLPMFTQGLPQPVPDPPT